MKKIASKEQQVIILAVILALVVLMAYYHLLFRPKVSTLGRLISQTGQLKRQLQEAKIEISDLERFTRKEKELQEKWDGLKACFLKEGQIPSLLGELSGVATKSGVKIVRIEPIKGGTASPSSEEGKKEAIYREVPVSIDARAGFHQLGRFINRLETGELFINVKDLRIIENPESPRVHEVSFKVCVLVLEGEQR